MDVSEVLIAFLITSSIACCLAAIKRIYRFKITTVSCCYNFIKFERDVRLEEHIDTINNNNRCIPSLRSDSTTTKTINLANPSLMV